MGCVASTSAVGVDDGDNTTLSDWKEVHSLARWNKDYEKLRRSIAESPNIVTLRDPKTMNTPLHISAQNGHEEVTEILIAGNADLNAKNGKGQTALHMAMSYDYYKVVRMLINAGCNEQMINDDGFAAITGLTGDKTVGMVSFAASETQEDIHAALDRIEVDLTAEQTEKPEPPGGVDKVEFIKIYLKLKKELGHAIWGEAEQSRFEAILKMFETIL